MKTFLSYCWGDATSAAEKIDGKFAALGIQLTRDVRDLAFKANVPGYQHSIGEHDHAVVIISDGYLRSENCMDEAIALLHSSDFEKKFLPLVLDGTRLFEASYPIEIVRYWEEKTKDLEDEYRKLASVANSQGTFDRLQKYKRILDHVDEFIRRVVAMRLETISSAESSGYKSILEHMGLSDSLAVSEVLKVLNIASEEDQLIELQRLRRKYPQVLEIDLIESHLHLKRGDYKLGLSMLEDRLKEFPENHLLHNNYGSAISQISEDYLGAKQEYERAIELKPDFGEGHYNLARLQHLHLNEIDSARHNYEQALKLRPNVPAIVNNYAVLLKNYSRGPADIDLAKKLLEALFASGELEGPEPYLTYSALLDDSFEEHEKAKEIMQEALNRYPEDPDVHHHLGVHAMNVDKDIHAAEKYFRTAVNMNPFNSVFNYHLGRLLFDKDHSKVVQGKESEAEFYLRNAVDLSPNNADAHYILFQVLVRSGLRLEEARPHYLAATKINKKYIDSATDKLFEVQRD